MIYEIRTHDVQPGKMAQYERALGKAMPHSDKYCRLVGSWRTELGPAHQAVHIWAYEDLDQRAAARAARQQDPNWPPDTGGVVLREYAELAHPLEAMGSLKSGHLGKAYELRYYYYTPKTILEARKRWEEAIPVRAQYFALAGAWHTNVGELDKVIVLWAYPTFNDRDNLRVSSARDPKYGSRTEDILMRRENKLLVPSEFSPLH